MTESICFVVPGAPVGKGRHRSAPLMRGGRPVIGKGGRPVVVHHSAEKTVAYEGLVALAARQVMVDRVPLAQAVAVDLEVVLAVPASWSKKKAAAALAGQVLPTKKPDTDNVVKAIFDGMNGVVWNDDVQACRLFVDKRYGATPEVRVSVSVIGEAA